MESRLLDGTYEPGRHGPLPDADEPVVMPAKPPGLSAGESGCWDELLRLLAPVVRERDGLMLADMARWRCELARIRGVLRRTKPGQKGYNQLLVAAAVASDKFDKIASRFGMTPSDRTKLRAEAAAVTSARVPTRPRTRLDDRGPP